MKRNNDLQRTNVLVIESGESKEKLLSIDLPDQQFTFNKVNAADDINSIITDNNYSLVLVNTESDNATVAGTLAQLKKSDSDIPIILVVDHTDEAIINEIGTSVTIDILQRPVAPKVLITRIKSICEHFNTRKELLHLRQQVAMNYGFDNFVGLSREILKIKRTIQHVAADNTTVIFSGENGTGKNLLAKIIHYHSARRHSPFVVLDCSAFTPEQLEVELFGAAHSAAQKASVFEKAENGTIFIDKINLLDLAAQSKLERYLQNNWNGVNSNNTENSKSFRVIVSVTEPVYDLIAGNKLSKSLINNLDAVEFSLPPLYQRTEDIELLTAYFLRLISYENDAPALTITPATVEMLKRHTWSGNVRELENCLRRAAALCAENTLDIADISFISIDSANRNLRDFVNDRQTKKSSLAESQRHLISEALDSNDWNFTQTAKQLGIGRTTLWRKVRKFSLSKETPNRMKSSGVTTDD